MRIVYIAHGIPVPGSLGGSTHAYEVARGLARRGHDVHLVAASKCCWDGVAPFIRLVSHHMDGFTLHHQNIPKSMGLIGWVPVWQLINRVRPHVVMERYYNFAGVGVWAARRLHIPCLLEVNARIVDPPVVLKRRLDDATGGFMRRWAVTQCQWADAIITPLHTTVPDVIPRRKIVELPWGADVERFSPINPTNAVVTDVPTAIFAGSFRAWHGAVDVVRAADMLLQQGRRYRFVLVGDGEEQHKAQQLAARWDTAIQFTGRVTYEAMPALLRRATVGVAPFTTTPHPALRDGFYWSPLKVYEYMASGLPVVTTNIPPLNHIIRDGQDGVLFTENNISDLARAIDGVLSEPHRARTMGASARERVVAHYSWQHHCVELEQWLVHIAQQKAPA